jgi:predicted  nucleic acid-binding Zn-ribbon protein
MAAAIAILHELHRLRRHIKGLQEEIERAPRLLKARQAALARQEEELKVAQDKLSKTKVTVRQRESALKEANQQVKKFEAQLREISSKKEYDTLQHEIAMARQRASGLEDEVLEAMFQVDEQTAGLPEQEKNLNQAREELVRFETTSQERVRVLTEELRKTEAALKEVENTMPESMKPEYDRLVAARGEDAMSLVQDRTCSACYTALTQQNYNDLLMGRLVQCKSCGRILYLVEEVSQTSA